jgi:hypothetical protein
MGKQIIAMNAANKKGTNKLAAACIPAINMTKAAAEINQ